MIYCNKNITKQPNSYAIGKSITLQCLLQFTKCALIIFLRQKNMNFTLLGNALPKKMSLM